MTTKRKRVVISFAEKLAAIEQVEKGSLLKIVAANYGVGVSTVSEWVKSKSIFLEQVVKNPNRKTSKPSDFEKVNEAVYLWYTQCREKGISLTGRMLQEKAKVFADLLGRDGKDFCASSGWLDRFKNRHGIRQLNPSSDEWVVADDSKELTDQDIVEAVLETPDYATESEEDDPDDGISKVTAEDGFNALKIALRFVEQCGESTPADVLFIKRWLDVANRKRLEGRFKKQKKSKK